MISAFMFWLMKPLAELAYVLILFAVLGVIWALITMGDKR